MRAHGNITVGIQAAVPGDHHFEAWWHYTSWLGSSSSRYRRLVSVFDEQNEGTTYIQEKTFTEASTQEPELLPEIIPFELLLFKTPVFVLDMSHKSAIYRGRAAVVRGNGIRMRISQGKV